MAKVLEYNATLTKRIDLEPTLSVFRVKPDAPFADAANAGATDSSAGDAAAMRAWFTPGQYLTIGMNRAVSDDDDPRPVSVRRPMSLASACYDHDAAEFYVRKVGTPASSLPLTHLLWTLREGDRLYLRPTPAGKFTVEDTCGVEDARLKVTIAAGTGLAPFVSMVRSRVLADPNASLSDFAILHGASYPSSLGYRDELEALAAEHGLHYIPTISRPHEVEGWGGFAGRAEALFGPEHLLDTEHALGLEAGGLHPDRAVVLICGLQGTIANALTALLARGFVPDNRRLRRALEVPGDAKPSVFWEQYDTTPILDVKNEALMGRLKTTLHAAARF